MKKVFYLSTCSTCIRIIKEVSFPSDIDWIDVKSNPIGEEDLTKLYLKTGSYEAVFSKRALKFSAMKDSLTDDKSYREWLLMEYTFLKRPIIVYDDFISVGSDKKAVEALKIKFGSA